MTTRTDDTDRAEQAAWFDLFRTLTPDEQRQAAEADEEARHSMGAIAWMLLALVVAAALVALAVLS